MYTMIIVDDEPYVRRGLNKLTDWAKNNIKIVGEASNGKQAYEIIKEQEPDIILTDIYMPQMNGLELTKKVKNLLPYSKVILLSGYQDFKYAQTAIKNNAFDYILKPIEKDKLIDVINNAKKRIDKELSQIKKEEELKKQIEQSLPVMKERYLDYVLNNRFNLEYILNHHQYLDLDLNMNNFVVMVLQINKRDNDNLDKFKFQLIMLDIKKIIKENIMEKYTGEVVEDYPYRHIVILNFNRQCNKKNIIEEIQCLAQKIKNNVYQRYKKNLIIGIGRLYKDYQNIPDSYQESLEALQYRLFPETDDVIYIGDVSVTNKPNAFVYPLKIEEKILTAMKIGDVEQSYLYAKRFIEAVLESEKLSPDGLKKTVLKLVYNIMRNIMEWNINEEFLNEEDIMEVQINKCNNIEELNICLIDFVKKIADINKKKKVAANKITINNVYRYIKNNYQRDISLEEIADFVGLTPNYLANKFKDITGKTVISYLIEYRMERARDLLTNTNLKIYEIAEKVGYNNSNYFSQVFKKEVGVSPNNYKKGTYNNYDL